MPEVKGAGGRSLDEDINTGINEAKHTKCLGDILQLITVKVESR